MFIQNHLGPIIHEANASPVEETIVRSKEEVPTRQDYNQ
jgi:hypothetical protein